MNKIKIGKKRGLTLIEVVIAIFVLCVGLLSILMLYPLGLETSRTSYHSTVAANFAQEKIEEMLSKDYQGVVSVNRSKINDLYDFQVRVSFVDPDNNMAESQVDKGIKRIEVTIFWSENQTPKKLSANTLYAKK